MPELWWTDPQLLLCDEPVSALDVSIQAQILNLLKDLQEKKKLTYVFVSHDMSVISHISDRVLVMYLGQAVELAEEEDLFEHPLHPYTQALMQAVPIPDPREQDQCKVLEGEIPSPMDLPPGCPFCARCKKALAICKEIRPQMAETADGHQVACHLYTGWRKAMKRYIILRVGKAVLTIWAVYTLVFFLTRVTGDPIEWLTLAGASDSQKKSCGQIWDWICRCGSST